MSDLLASPSKLFASRAGWALSLYPEAGEGGGCFVPTHRPDRSYVPRGQAENPQRSDESAGRRARGMVRRYCAANRLNRLGTLTYGEPRCSDPAEVREHVGLFFRELRSLLGGEPLPYLWVPELHKDGVHFHVHFAVGRYVPQRLIKSAWGRGFVSIKQLGGGPIGSGKLGEARIAARYLSKYVGKSFDEAGLRAMGLHRYDVAQGFQPRKLKLYGCTADSVIAQASALFGAAPAHTWNSDQEDDWEGPPAIFVQWDGDL